jgi:LysM repeat protein
MLKAIAIAIALVSAAAALLGLMAFAQAGSTAGPARQATATAAQPAPAQAAPPARAPEAQSQRPAQPARPVAEHRVVAGDTLSRIALRYQTPLEQIAADNAITEPNRIMTGQRLVIRPAPAGVQVIQPGATLTSCAVQHGVSVGELTALNPQISNPDRIIAGGMLRIAPPAGG